MKTQKQKPQNDASDQGLHHCHMSQIFLDTSTNSQMTLYKQEKCDLFVLRFYGPVNPMGSCRVRSVYLTTRLLGRVSPLRG